MFPIRVVEVSRISTLGWGVEGGLRVECFGVVVTGGECVSGGQDISMKKSRCPAKVPEQQSSCEGINAGGLEVVMRVAS